MTRVLSAHGHDGHGLASFPLLLFVVIVAGESRAFRSLLTLDSGMPANDRAFGISVSETATHGLFGTHCLTLIANDAVESGDGSWLGINGKSENIGDVQDANASRAESENEMRLLEERVNLRQTRGGKSGGELHRQTSPQAADGLHVEEYGLNIVRIQLFWQAVETRKEFAFGQFDERAKRKREVPDGYVFGYEVNARDERRKKANLLVLVSNSDPVLPEKRAGVKFGPGAIHKFVVSLNECAGGTVDLADANLEVLRVHKLFHSGQCFIHLPRTLRAPAMSGPLRPRKSSIITDSLKIKSA